MKRWTIIFALIFTVFYVVFAPSYFRAKKRSRATKIVNDARIYEYAIAQWEQDRRNKRIFYGPPAPGQSNLDLQTAERNRYEAALEQWAKANPALIYLQPTAKDDALKASPSAERFRETDATPQAESLP